MENFTRSNLLMKVGQKKFSLFWMAFISRGLPVQFSISWLILYWMVGQPYMISSRNWPAIEHQLWHCSIFSALVIWHSVIKCATCFCTVVLWKDVRSPVSFQAIGGSLFNFKGTDVSYYTDSCGYFHHQRSSILVSVSLIKEEGEIQTVYIA
jgi:hypothetical protein